MVENDPNNLNEQEQGLSEASRVAVLRALHRTLWICGGSFLFFIMIHILHLCEMGVIWDRIGLVACIVVLLYAAASFVQLMILKGKIGEKSEYKLVVTALIFSATLFLTCIVAILFGVGVF
jgi:hypothetical protein